MKTEWGIPIVTADTIFLHLVQAGIVPWVAKSRPILLDTFIKGELTDTERGVLSFVPKIEIVNYEKPNGASFRGCRTSLKDWATVFCLFPGDFVAIVGQWMHGAEVLSLAPPSGSIDDVDNQSMIACALREVAEETGFLLRWAIPLGGGTGLPIGSRGSSTRIFPFLGELATPIVPGKRSLDPNEHLELMLIPLIDWLLLINSGKVNEECAVSTTYLALERLGRLKLM